MARLLEGSPADGQSLAVIPGSNPAQPALIVGTPEGIETSVDGGATWQAAQLPAGGGVSALERDPEPRPPVRRHKHRPHLRERQPRPDLASCQPHTNASHTISLRYPHLAGRAATGSSRGATCITSHLKDARAFHIIGFPYNKDATLVSARQRPTNIIPANTEGGKLHGILE